MTENITSTDTVTETVVNETQVDQQDTTHCDSPAYAKIRCCKANPTNTAICTQVIGHTGDHVARDSMSAIHDEWLNLAPNAYPEVTVPAAPDVMTERLQTLTDEVARLRGMIDGYEQRINGLTSRIVGYEADWELVSEELLSEAESRGWCSEYEEFVNKVNRALKFHNGLNIREHDYDVTFTYEVQITRCFTARNGDDALDQARYEIDERTIRRELEAHGWSASVDETNSDVTEV